MTKNCAIGTYMADPTKGASFIRLTKVDVSMINVLIEKHKNHQGKMNRYCPDCGRRINWEALGGKNALYVLEHYQGGEC